MMCSCYCGGAFLMLSVSYAGDIFLERVKLMHTIMSKGDFQMVLVVDLNMNSL